MRITKQKGKYINAIVHLSREEGLDVLRLAEKEGLTVSRLLKNLCVPLVKARLAELEAQP